MFEKCPDRTEIERIVKRQLGHVTRTQLLERGVGREWVRTQVDRGLLIPVHAGVYAVGHVPQHAHARSMAAVLACGPGAALSHDAALALYGLAEWPRTLEVTAPRQCRRPAITTHRSAILTRRDVRPRHGIRVTSPVRTILDVQSRRPDDRLVRLINDARLRDRLGPTALDDLLTRSARIRALIDPGQRPTRSELEDLFRRFARRHRLPLPETNAIIAELGGREVDALYRAEKVIVELDSWKFHPDRESFELDRDKDTAALAKRYATIRITKRQLIRGGAAKAAEIRAILADRNPGQTGTEQG